MGKLFLFILALFAVTIASAYTWFPLFVVIGSMEALVVLLWATIGIFNVIVYDMMKYRNYTIFKGFHNIIGRFFVPILYLNKSKTVEKQFVFSESCRYDSDEITCTHKLFGISFGWHHKNSARFGWKYNELSGRIIPSAYIYKNGVRYIYECFEEVNIGQIYTYKITTTDYNKISFTITRNLDNKIIGTYDVELSELPRWGYKLYPYFGGDPKAPHKVKIKEVYF